MTQKVSTIERKADKIAAKPSRDASTQPQRPLLHFATFLLPLRPAASTVPPLPPHQLHAANADNRQPTPAKSNTCLKKGSFCLSSGSVPEKPQNSASTLPATPVMDSMSSLHRRTSVQNYVQRYEYAVSV